jgi:hypothetical protein
VSARCVFQSSLNVLWENRIVVLKGTEFEKPDVKKDFQGLYATESGKKKKNCSD